MAVRSVVVSGSDGGVLLSLQLVVVVVAVVAVRSEVVSGSGGGVLLLLQLVVVVVVVMVVVLVSVAWWPSGQW